MPEKDTIFSSKTKYQGIMDFQEFYKFCYNWLVDEVALNVIEEKYSEKIVGDAKNIDIIWVGTKKITDYFKEEIKVTFQILGLTKIEIIKEGKKIKTNNGSVEVKTKGTLIRDYEGKFETTSSKKFLRSIYEKWVIPSRILEFEEKIISDCNEFLSQAKAFLDIEGNK